MAEFPREHIEDLSWYIEGGGMDYEAFRLRLDLLGYDSADEITFKNALRQARQVLRDRRFFHGVLGRYTSLRLSNSDLGRVLHLPKSTVQAIASGRMKERFTAQQREALKSLFVHTLNEVKACLDDLG